MKKIDRFDVLAVPSLNALLSEYVDKGTIPADLRGRKVEVQHLHVDHANRQFVVFVKGRQPIQIPMNNGFVPASSGSSYNIVVGLSNFGMTTGIMGAIGNDMFSSQLSESLSSEGIPLMAIPRGMGTPVTLSCLEHGDNPVTTLFVYKPKYELPIKTALGLLNNKTYDFVMATGVRDSEVEFTTRLFAMNQESNFLVPNGSLCQSSHDMSFQILLKMTHIIQVNFEEAQMLTGKATNDLREMTNIISAKGPKRVIITRDKDGVFIGRVNKSGGMKYYECPAFPTDVVDTEGAGDAFSVGFVYALQHSLPIRKCLEVGTWVASKNIAKVGGYGGMPTLAELQQIL